MNNKPRIIISGGGTGGHIYPALSIANAIKEIKPEAEFLFVGAKNRMEMEKVPAAGYKIVGLPVAGLQRKNPLKNLGLPFKVLKSLRLARKIIREFKPDVAVGVGGYASAPLLWCASKMKVPYLIQEQNSYAGLTNKILAKKAARICTAYEGMEKFFPADRIVLTGNPIRKEIAPADAKTREEGYGFFGLDPKKKTLFVVGGSLGARTLNQVMENWVTKNSVGADYQVIWQCGKLYKADLDQYMKGKDIKGLWWSDFVYRMDLAYAVSDLVISRAGAGTISELCAAGKATVFVPSPVVAEDHQTHNAMALVNTGAAVMVRDDEAAAKLIQVAEEVLSDSAKISEMEDNILKLSRRDASELIAKEVLTLIK